MEALWYERMCTRSQTTTNIFRTSRRSSRTQGPSDRPLSACRMRRYPPTTSEPWLFLRGFSQLTTRRRIPPHFPLSIGIWIYRWAILICFWGRSFRRCSFRVRAFPCGCGRWTPSGTGMSSLNSMDRFQGLDKAWQHSLSQVVLFLRRLGWSWRCFLSNSAFRWAFWRRASRECEANRS